MSHPIPQEVEEKLAQFMRDFILISEPLTVHQRVEAQEALLSVYNSGREAEREYIVDSLEESDHRTARAVEALAPSSEDNA